MTLGMEDSHGQGNVVLGTQLPPQKGSPSNFWPMSIVANTAGWITMPIGTEESLCPGLIVLDEDPAPREKGTAPDFRSMPIVAKRLDG